MTEPANVHHPAAIAAAVRDYARDHQDRHVRQLCDLVRIPSVSASREHADGIAQAAAAVADVLRRAGAPRVRVYQTAGNPVVVGGWPAPSPAHPTALVYGHYDTQPADPLEQWDSPPFEPVVRDGRVYGRGASDNKGTLLIPILACEALTHLAGRPQIGVTFLIEGDEEILSPHLRSFMSSHRDELRADCVVSADSVMWSDEQPSLIRRGRGLINIEIRVRSAKADVHSGVFGGIMPNAGIALAHLIATMVAPTGEITIDGFYDGVAGPSDRDQRLLASINFDIDRTLREHGVTDGWGESAFDPLTRLWHRPTLELNGFHSGYGGNGPKAVIPAEAYAKVSCRLVDKQTPDQVFAAIARHLKRHAQPQIELEVSRHEGGTGAFTIDPHNPAFRIAAEALRRVYGKDPVEISLGASLPFASIAEEVLGLKTVMFGWQMPDERLHAPNEFFRLANLEKGMAAYAEFFNLLSGHE